MEALMANGPADATLDIDLDEAVGLLEQDLTAGSPEEARVREVVARVREAHPEAGEAPDHPFAARLTALERRLESLGARRRAEDDKYRTSPGDDDGIEPLLGGDIRKSFEPGRG
jgi:hypothetical protein